MNALVLIAMLTAGADAPPSSPASPQAHTDLGPIALFAGIGVGALSAAAFADGFEAERALQASVHTEKDADDLLNRRTMAGWVAYSAAVVSVAAVGAGVWILNSDDEAAR